MSARALALLALAAACAGGPGDGPSLSGKEQSGRLRAVVDRPVSDTTRDTIRFGASALFYHCRAPGSGALVDAVGGASGVLIWFRPADSALAGRYTYEAATDSGRARTAVLAVRFVAQDAPRGLVLDSGHVEISERRGRLRGVARGSGLATPGGQRVSVRAEFADVRVRADTVSCEVEG